MITTQCRVALLVFALLCHALSAREREAYGAETEPLLVDIDFFERHVRPVLAAHCWNCHGEKRRAAGLRPDSRESMLRGSEFGPILDTDDLSPIG